MMQPVLRERSIFFVAERNAVTNVVTCVGYALVTVGYSIGYKAGYNMPATSPGEPCEKRLATRCVGGKTSPGLALPVDFQEICH